MLLGECRCLRVCVLVAMIARSCSVFSVLVYHCSVLVEATFFTGATYTWLLVTIWSPATTAEEAVAVRVRDLVEDLLVSKRRHHSMSADWLAIVATR